MKVLTDNQYYGQIADIVREQNRTNNTYKPAQMVSALKDLFYEEVEGAPPITFQGIGENLLDYRIDGASGGVGERTSNLLQNTASSQTINGVTFTVNNDGSIICNGTSSAVTTFAISIKLNSNINYVLSGSPKNGGFETYRLDLRNISYSVYNTTFDNGDGINFTVEENGTYLVCIRIAANYTCNNLTFYPMIRLASIQDDTYEPYGYKVPVVISGKNLFNEITYQGSVNNVGNIVDSTRRIRSEYIDVDENETYTCSSNLKIRLIYAYNNEYNKVGCIYDVVQGKNVVTFVIPIGATKIMISFMDDGNPNNEITPNDFLWGQLEKGSIATDYEPYHEPTTTNIYLDEPIGENESISLSDTNTNIPTIRGTNVLTVDTTVQPSKVYVKSRKESQYETAMREEYEQELSNIESALEEV